jgi:5-methylcytosine-specific restriction endonuclease McrA
VRICKTCGEAKPDEAFPPRGRSDRVDAEGRRDRRPHCRSCYKPKRKPDTLREQKRRHYLRHYDRYKARQRTYNRTPEGRTALRRNNLRSRYGIADVGHTEADWLRLLAQHDGKCFYCGEPATERDHILPLSRGGSDYIGNILPSCRGCNNSKDKKLLVEFLHRKR